jgi:hypothetical protein
VHKSWIHATKQLDKFTIPNRLTNLVPCSFTDTLAAVAAPRRVTIRGSTKADIAARPGFQGIFGAVVATEIDGVSSAVHRALRLPEGIPLYSPDVVSYARARFGFTTSPAPMLRAQELRIVRVIQGDRIPLAPTASNVDRYQKDFCLVEVEARPRIAGRRSGVRFYVPDTAFIYLQTLPDGLSPVFTVLPIETVTAIEGGRDLLAAVYEAGPLLAAEIPIIRIGQVQVAGTVIGQAAASEGPVPQFLDMAPLEAALLLLCLMVVGDHTREYNQDGLLELLCGARITQALLPSARGLQASRFGVPQFQILPGSVRHATAVYYTLQDVVLSVSFTCTPPTAVGPRYELQQVALFDPAFVDAFPTPTLTAESIEQTLRSGHYPFARITIREPSQHVRGHGERYIGRVFLPSVASFRMVQRDHPGGMPLSTTTHTGGVITSRMVLEPPPGGYPHHGPGELGW